MAKKIKDENGKIYVEKKPFYKKIWFIVLVIVIAISVIIKLGGNNNNVSNNTNVNDAKTKELTYIEADAGKMLEDLDANALNAQKTYKDQFLAITGKIYNIDSSGKYISIEGLDNDSTITGITCNLKNDEQREIVAETKKGQTVVIRGLVTDVGEVMGYTVSVDEITAK